MTHPSELPSLRRMDRLGPVHIRQILAVTDALGAACFRIAKAPAT